MPLFNSSERFYWLYILGFLVLAVVAWRLATRMEGEKAGFWSYCFPRQVYTHVSTILDLKFYMVGRIISAAVLLVLLPVGVTGVGREVAGLLTQAFGGTGWHLYQSLPVRVVFTTLVAMAFDFGAFYAHYLTHKRHLWHLHKVHHSAEVMTPLILYRMHPVDGCFGSILSAVTGGIAMGILSYLIGKPVMLSTVLELGAWTFFLYLTGYHLRHSHIWLNYPRWLSYRTCELKDWR